MNLLKHLNMEMIYVKNILCNGLIIITKKQLFITKIEQKRKY